jgi:hypothetical protein
MLITFRRTLVIAVSVFVILAIIAVSLPIEYTTQFSVPLCNLHFMKGFCCRTPSVMAIFN